MERIKHAIEKARAERQEREEGQGTTAPIASAEPLPVSTKESPTDNRTARGPRPSTASPSESSEAAWLALGGFQPKPSLMRRNRIVSFEGGPLATSFDVLRTRILLQMRTNNWRRLAITSPGAACGKTMTSLNLAFSLARQPEVRNILVEMDMRRPAMAKTLGLKKQQLFSRVLGGNESPEDHLVRYGTNLAIGTNYRPATNPAELLMNPRTGEVLAAIEERYDPTLMIFDMPPMLAGDDTMAFLDQVDCVLLVGAAESTTIKEVDLCEQDLARHTNVLGVVLNKCRYLDEGQGYGNYDYG